MNYNSDIITAIGLIALAHTQHSSGGPLHIVIDDHNCERHDIEWCKKNIDDDKYYDTIEECTWVTIDESKELMHRLADHLLSMPKSDVYTAIAMYWGHAI